jgi:hypothetical protein
MPPSLHYPTWKSNRQFMFVAAAIAVGLVLGWLLVKGSTPKPERA